MCVPKRRGHEKRGILSTCASHYKAVFYFRENDLDVDADSATNRGELTAVWFVTFLLSGR